MAVCHTTVQSITNTEELRSVKRKQYLLLHTAERFLSSFKKVLSFVIQSTKVQLYLSGVTLHDL